MTLPNKITFFRLIMAPIGAGFLFYGSDKYGAIIALVIFLVAMLSDVLDGYLARKNKQITDLGIYLDSLSDKIIILLYFILLTWAGYYPTWLFIAFFFREMFMDGFKNFALSKGAIISAQRSGKNKALLQTISILVALLSLSISQGVFEIQNTESIECWLEAGAYYSMLLSFLISIYGAYALIKPNLKVFKNQ
jgi:CDP-diacylglycerol---glycerol-3-phosphate 3-phosphatidyltransferase